MIVGFEVDVFAFGDVDYMMLHLQVFVLFL
jgi:hypothetical protein